MCVSRVGYSAKSRVTKPEITDSKTTCKITATIVTARVCIQLLLQKYFTSKTHEKKTSTAAKSAKGMNPGNKGTKKVNKVPTAIPEKEITKPCL